MLDIAIIDVGLKPHEFWEMTFVDFLRCIVGKAKSEANEWERTRAVLSFILNTNVGKTHQRKPEQIVPLWTDTLARRRKKITPEERDEMLRKLRERRAKKDE